MSSSNKQTKPQKQTSQHRFQDEVGEGPRDIQGAEASELLGQGRGGTDTDFGKEASRKIPSQTGGTGRDGDDVGIAGEPEVADARRHGGRKHN